jgi:hypothetical protein
MTSHSGPVYQASYGRTYKHFIAIGFGLVMSAIFLSAAVPAWPKLIVVGTFGGTALVLARLALSRKPALRVDSAGVTIRPYPLRFKAIAFYPWADVDRIVLLPVQHTPAQCVLIELRDGASLFGGRPVRSKSQKAIYFAQAGVAVNGWTLHPARLAAAVTYFAPGVQVIDGSTGFAVSPEQLPEPGDHGTD